MAALNQDNVLLSLHGRRVGLLGDGQGDLTPTGLAGLVIDNTVILLGGGVTSGRGMIQQLSGTSGSGAGAVTLTGAVIGDKVLSVLDASASPFSNQTSVFESTISVANQIQQTGSMTGSHNLLVTLQPQS